MLGPLTQARDNCEKILTQNNILFFKYDKLIKPFYEYLPGQRKESIVNPHIEILMQKDLGVFERAIFEDRNKALKLKSIDPQDP